MGPALTDLFTITATANFDVIFFSLVPWAVFVAVSTIVLTVKDGFQVAEN